MRGIDTSSCQKAVNNLRRQSQCHLRPENCHVHLFSKARCHSRSGKLPRNFGCRRIHIIYRPKIATHNSFSKARFHLWCRKLPRALVSRKFNVIHGPEICHAHLLFQGSKLFMNGKIVVRHCFSKTRYL